MCLFRVSATWKQPQSSSATAPLHAAVLPEMSHRPFMNTMKLVILLHFVSWKKTPNDVVTPQRQSQFTPRWKQTRFRLCFHLWCELTSTMNVTEWQVSWNSRSMLECSNCHNQVIEVKLSLLSRTCVLWWSHLTTYRPSSKAAFILANRWIDR